MAARVDKEETRREDCTEIDPVSNAHHLLLHQLQTTERPVQGVKRRAPARETRIPFDQERISQDGEHCSKDRGDRGRNGPDSEEQSDGVSTQVNAKRQRALLIRSLALNRYHLGLLKGKLAKLRMQLLEPASKSSKPGEGFDVMKSGDARVALIGFPSVGKSTLLNKVTKTASLTAAYEYTTLTAIPGVIEYQGARIQLLDLPGIIEGASQGRGRGRQVVSVAKTADLVLIMLDATKSATQRPLLEKELEDVGIRLNKQRPDITIRKRNTGGITISKAMGVTFNHIDAKMIKTILQSYKMHNVDVLLREDITVDQFLDVLLGNRKYTPCLYVYNKIDSISMEQMDKLAREPHSIVISCEQDLNLDYLIDRIWEELDLLRIYTKKRGRHPDLEDPLVVRKGATVEHVCHVVHRAIVDKFKYALIYGKSSKFPTEQKVGLGHVVADHDVITIFTK